MARQKQRELICDVCLSPDHLYRIEGKVKTVYCHSCNSIFRTVLKAFDSLEVVSECSTCGHVLTSEGCFCTECAEL